MVFEFAIRDDDPGFFTEPEELESAYGGREDLVISYSVVPYQGCTAMPSVPDHFHEKCGRFPVGQNEPLVDYLNSKISAGRASILQHGYDHVYQDGLAEFVYAKDAFRRLQKGREHLESVFQEPINTFVPPSNSFSRRGLDAVKDIGMRTLYYPTPINRPKTPEVLALFSRDVIFKYQHKNTGPINFIRDANAFWRRRDRSKFMPVRPTVYRERGIPEFTCVSMTRSSPIDPILKQMEIADKYNGKFCLAVHYHSFRDDAFVNKFDQVLNYARRKLDPQFVSVSALFE